jgi:hypothetical protein
MQANTCASTVARTKHKVPAMERVVSGHGAPWDAFGATAGLFSGLQQLHCHCFAAGGRLFWKSMLAAGIGEILMGTLFGCRTYEVRVHVYGLCPSYCIVCHRILCVRVCEFIRLETIQALKQTNRITRKKRQQEGGLA